MRPVISAPLIVLVAVSLCVGDDSAPLKPIDFSVTDMAVGKVGRFFTTESKAVRNVPYITRYLSSLVIEKVLDDRSMVVRYYGNRDFLFIVNRDTKGLVDAKPITLTEIYKVTGTKKLGTRTVYVLDLVPEPKVLKVDEKPNKEKPEGDKKKPAKPPTPPVATDHTPRSAYRAGRSLEGEVVVVAGVAEVKALKGRFLLTFSEEGRKLVVANVDDSAAGAMAKAAKTGERWQVEIRGQVGSAGVGGVTMRDATVRKARRLAEDD